MGVRDGETSSRRPSRISGTRWTSLIGALGLAVTLLAACQPHSPAALTVAPAPQQQATGRVQFKLNVPRKVSKGVRRVANTGTESSTLLVNRVDVVLSGPGFFSPLYPADSQAGSIDVRSGSIASHIENVPTGQNRFIKVVAWNGAKKLNQIGGVIDVQPGFQNHVTVGLSTTPTAAIIEKLALKAPDASRTLSSGALQYFLDTYVTRPVTNDPMLQNVFQGVHPYRVNPAGVVDYLIANNYQIPADFDATREADQAFVLQEGQVVIKTDGLPDGSRIWLNDPTSEIIETSNPATTDYTIGKVAPNFEAVNGETGTPAWTLTVLTPTGKIYSTEVEIGRHTLAENPTTITRTVDIRSALQQADTQIQRIYLSPSESTWTGSHVTLNGRVAQQLFVYAEDLQGRISPLLPSALDWTSLDARVKVGSGTLLDANKLGPLGQATSGLEDVSLEDYGLVYPLDETSSTDATDLARVKGTLKGTAISAEMGFRIGYLSDSSGRVKIDVRSVGIKVLPDVQTLTTFGEGLPFTAVEADAPEGVTYDWVADHPAIRIDGTGPTVNVASTADLGTATALLTVTSSTGRQATARVGTAFGLGKVAGSVKVPTHLATFDGLVALNPTDADVTAKASEPLGGYLNVFMGAATVGATDPDEAGGGKYIWKSSDPFIIAVSGAFPSRTATVTAFRPGTVTLTAIDPLGRQIRANFKAQFDKVGIVNGSVLAPDSGISLVGAEAGVEAALKSVFGQGTFEAAERDVADPAFRWISLDPFRLQVTPPLGQVFPHKQATLKLLQPGPATIRLISARTGKSRTFLLNLTLANGTASGQVKVPSLAVRQVVPAPPAGSTATLVVARDLGELATVEATDSTDPTPTFVWTAVTPDLLSVVSQSGNQAQLRFLDYGTGQVRVVNTRTGRWGTLKFDIQTTGKGTGNIKVTL